MRSLLALSALGLTVLGAVWVSLIRGLNDALASLDRQPAPPPRR